MPNEDNMELAKAFKQAMTEYLARKVAENIKAHNAVERATIIVMPQITDDVVQ